MTGQYNENLFVELASEGEYDDEFTDSPRVKIMLD
jgi:hypothetical protein